MTTITERLDKRVPVENTKKLLIAGVLVLLVIFPIILNRFYVSLLYTVLFFVVLSCSLNIHSGYTGYINFGFALFVGIGSYTSALGVTYTNLPVIGLWLFGGVTTAFIAAVLSYPLLRINGVYFSIAILAIAEGARALMSLSIIDNWTNGGSGISLGVNMTLTDYYYAMAILAVLVIFTTYLIATHRIGLELLAIRENEQVVESLGIDLKRRKIGSFVLSGLFAGIAGAINATYLSYIDPNVAFNLNYTIEPVAMAMIGSFGTVVGPVIGAVIIKLVEQLLWAQFLELNQLFFGAVVILGVILIPSGLIRWAQHRGYISWSRKW